MRIGQGHLAAKKWDRGLAPRRQRYFPKIVEEDPEEIAHIANLFYRAAGSSERCSTSAVGALRQDLPLYAALEAPFMEDVCNRIANAFPQT